MAARRARRGLWLLGVFLIAHGHSRHGAVLRAIDRGDNLPPDGPQQPALSVAGVILGITLVVLVVVLEVRS